MGAVVKILSANSSSAEVQKALDYVCMHVMPSTIRDECKAFIDQYEPVIVALLVKQVDPDKICQLIGICPKKEKILQKPKFEITVRFKTFLYRNFIISCIKQNPQCIICEFVLTTLEKYISKNATGVRY
jgi:hypothetical protein